MSDIIFTNEFKDLHVSTRNNVNFTLKGYALYSKNLGDNLENITYNDVKSSITKLHNVTYIPALEYNNVENIKLGVYEIPMNKGIYTDEFKSSENKYVLLIGVDLRENEKLYTELTSNEYLAAIIPVENFVEDKISKYILRMSYCGNEKVDVSDITYDSDYMNAIEPSKIKDANTILYFYNLTLKNENIDEIGNSQNFNGNLVLMDESNKVSNNWNPSAKVFIGLNRENELDVPHIQFTNCNDYSVSVVYNPDNYYFGMNFDNDFCNVANLFSYDNNIEYGYSPVFNVKSNNNNNNISAMNVFNLCSNENEFITDTNAVNLINSNSNKLNVTNENELGANSLFLDSNNISVNGRFFTLINTDKSIVSANNVFENNTFIGVDNFEQPTNDNNSITLCNKNITLIGENNQSTYTPASAKNSNKELIGFSGLTVTNYDVDTVVFGNYNADVNPTATDNYGDKGKPVFVVANGRKFTDTVVTGHSPIEFASTGTDYSNDCIRLNTFSVEKDSIQEVHTSLNETQTANFNTIFAIRNIEPITQKYVNIDTELTETVYKYNLQNAIYTTSALLIPLRRTCNDCYKITMEELYKVTQGDYSNLTHNNYTFSDLQNEINSHTTNTYVVKASELNGNYTLNYIKEYCRIENSNFTTVYLANDTKSEITFNEESISVGKTKKLYLSTL